MKQIIIYFIILLVFVGCQKALENENIEELNITYKSAEGITPPTDRISVNFYPNPFRNQLVCDLSGGMAQLTISDGNGKMKIFTTDDSSFYLDFNEEPAGSYLCEVEINGVVIREYLIKSE